MKQPAKIIPVIALVENNIDPFPEQDLKEKNLVKYNDLNIISKIWFKEVTLKESKEFEFLLLIKAIAMLSNWQKGINAFLWKIQIDFNMTIPDFHLKK